MCKNDNLTNYVCQLSGNLGAPNSWNRGCFTFCVFNLGSKNRFFNSGCTNPGLQVVRTTKLCAVAPICGFSVCKLLHVNFLKSRILRRLLDSCSSGLITGIRYCHSAGTVWFTREINNNNNNNNILQFSCHPVAVVILHVYKT